jgi:hypothetical protein
MVVIKGRYAATGTTRFEQDLENLRGHPRVWIIMSHFRRNHRTVNDEPAVRAILERMGKCISRVSATGAVGSIYTI